MGRSSKKNEQTKATETTELHEQTSTTTFPFTAENNLQPRGAVSESESMARDIKEGRLSGFVGAGTVLTGETNFQTMLRVDGHLTGKVGSEEGTLIIGSTGQVDADINVAAAVVNGTVNGDIIASEKLELGRTAKVVGNVQAPRLLVEDGAILEGNCTMVKSKENLAQRIADQKQQLSTNELPSYSVISPATVEDETDDKDETDSFSSTSKGADEDKEEETAEAATN
jgi:cytoskeletal protein CcmA (bactofilin family)